MGKLLKLVEEINHGKDFSETISLVESIENDINVGDVIKFPKINFLDVNINRRSGDVIKGDRVMGFIRFANREATLLVPSRYDYKEVGPLKDGVILALLENNLTKPLGSTYLNATIVKINLKTKTITLPSEAALSGEVDHYDWDRAIRAKDIVIHLPFKKTVD